MAHHSPATPDGEAPPRFRWPMRIFLSFLIFDMVFHSLAVLTPYRDWLRDDFKLDRLPKRLPTLEEIGKLEEETGPAQPSSVSESILDSFDSVWEFLKPWPDRETRKKLTTWDNKGKFVLCWLTSRLDFLENVVGIPQRWTMFSPNAHKGATVARIRLQFEDGSLKDVRLHADPEDLTHYSHWFEEKILDYELKVHHDYDSRLGYCNYLKHQFKQNQRGSPLEKIYIYKIKYRYPDPDEDAAAVLCAQNGPPNWDRAGPDFVYDVASDRLRTLENEKERKRIQQSLDRAKKATPG
jgi:hypothetical protein